MNMIVVVKRVGFLRNFDPVYPTFSSTLQRLMDELLIYITRQKTLRFN